MKILLPDLLSSEMIIKSKYTQYLIGIPPSGGYMGLVYMDGKLQLKFEFTSQRAARSWLNRFKDAP